MSVLFGRLIRARSSLTRYAPAFLRPKDSRRLGEQNAQQRDTMCRQSPCRQQSAYKSIARLLKTMQMLFPRSLTEMRLHLPTGCALRVYELGLFCEYLRSSVEFCGPHLGNAELYSICMRFCMRPARRTRVSGSVPVRFSAVGLCDCKLGGRFVRSHPASSIASACNGVRIARMHANPGIYLKSVVGCVM